MNRLENAVVFAASTLGIEATVPQARYLLARRPQKILTGGRRSGKSTVLAIEIIHEAARAVRDHRTLRQLIVAPALDQARLLFSKVSSLLAGSSLGGLVQSEVQSPFPEMRLPHDGLIFVRAAHENGKHLRGHSAHRVVIDEASYMADRIIEESIGPILADSGGDLVLASTPSAKGALFHRLWERGRSGSDPRILSFTMRSLDNPHVSTDYIEAQRGQLTEAQFAAEYLGNFLDQTGNVFRFEHLVACATGAEEEPLAGHRYVIGWDPARQRDRSGVAVVDATAQPWRVVRAEDLRGADYTVQVQYVADLAARYNRAQVMMDQTGVGLALLDQLRRGPTWVEGVTFTAAVKADIVAGLALLVERHQLVLPSRSDVIDEFRYFEARVGVAGRTTFSAPESSKIHDDMVIAVGLAVFGAGEGHRGFSFKGLRVNTSLAPAPSPSTYVDASGRTVFVARDRAGGIDDAMWQADTEWAGSERGRRR